MWCGGSSVRHYPGRNDVQGFARALHKKERKILARLEFGLQKIYNPYKTCKNLVIILQEKDYFPNKYAKLLQDFYKIRLHNLPSCNKLYK